MSTLTRSAWKLTLSPSSSPLVLLDFGDAIEDEPEFGVSRLADVVPLVRSASPKIVDNSNLSYRFSVQRWLAVSTDAAARVAVLQSLGTAVARAPQVLRIDISGHSTAYWQFANAVVTATTGRRKISALPRHRIAIEILATGLTEVAIPPP